MKQSTANALIVFGILSLALSGYLIWQRNTPRRLQFNVQEVHSSEARETFGRSAQSLIINDLQIELPIIPAEITNGKWEASKSGVSHLASSPTPGETGNSILYGHNWGNLLGRLKYAKPGQKIEVVFSDGLSEEFRVTHTQVVTPDKVDILDQTDDKRITLYTCIGFLDRERFVVTAQLVDG